MYAILIGNAASPLIERYTQPTPYGKGAPRRARGAASYAKHPRYISRDGDVSQPPSPDEGGDRK